MAMQSPEKTEDVSEKKRSGKSAPQLLEVPAQFQYQGLGAMTQNKKKKTEGTHRTRTACF